MNIKDLIEKLKSLPELTPQLILIIFIVLMIVVFSLNFYADLQASKMLKMMTFKIAKISDNLGDTSFKIVGLNKEGKYQELNELIILNNRHFTMTPHKDIDHFFQSFLSKEIADQELNNFLIQIGQKEYKKEIEIC